MDRRERNALLERLVAYRRVYHLRSDYDSKPVITVAAAVAYGERLAQVSRMAAIAPRLA